jgi:predicted aminopeptidase
MIISRSPAPWRFLRAVFIALCLAGATSACSTVDYYRQAIGGHLHVMLKREAIEKVLVQPDTPGALRRKLELVSTAREFASNELGLPDNGSYRSYADLGRPYVVWNVFATPALSLEPVTSCFLFVGCLSYRGYFDATDALREGERLRQSGHDVFVGGVAAYSTLGWFDDPVLNTMLVWDDARIVEVIFHELAHQRIYAPDDSVFNESFATTLAQAGLARWAALDPANRWIDPDRVQRDAAFYDLLLGYRSRLEAAYASGDDTTKRARKTALFDQLRQDYTALKAAFGGYTGFDEWMASDLNNAKLSSIATYHDYVPGFRTILARTNNDFERFYALVEVMTSWTAERRRLCLADPTTGAACLDELVATH